MHRNKYSVYICGWILLLNQKFSHTTVQAGSFEALEISGQYTITTIITFVTREFAGTVGFWFGMGVGMVKDFVEQDGVYFLELVDNFIPER
jgi:hypothetical protein